MAKGPYRVFSWRLSFFILGPVIAGLVWLLVGLSGLPEDPIALFVLSMSTGGFTLCGLIPFIVALRVRIKRYRSIVYQNDRMAVVCEVGDLRHRPDVLKFATRFVNLHVQDSIVELLRTEFKLPSDATVGEIPFVFVKMQVDDVPWEFMGLEKLVNGKAVGKVCTIKIQHTWQQTACLANHEVGHVMIMYPFGRRWMPESQQHTILKSSGVERASYLDGLFNGSVYHGL